MKKLHYLCLGLALVLAACGKDDPNPPDDPTTNPPTIASFSPQQGTPGTTVEITGTNFSTVKTENTVKFNGTSASVSIATATKLTVSVPNGATSGKIAVTVDGQTAQSSTDFTVTEPSVNAPAIDGFTPSHGYPGSTVYIEGSNFSSTTTENIVMFNGVQANVTYADPNLLEVTVPNGAETGLITVTVNGQTAQKNVIFTVTDPPQISINFFTPIQENVGAQVSIVGANFDSDSANNTVKFNGVAAQVTAATATNLTVTVPEGATTGTITVTVGEQTAESATEFTVGPWRKLADFPGQGRRNAFMAALEDGNGNPIIIAGLGYTRSYTSLDDIWIYNPDNNNWTQNDTSFPGGATHGAFSLVIDNKLIIGGGYSADSDGYVKICYEFDPSSNSWNQDLSLLNSFPENGAPAFVVGQKGYVFGEYNGSAIFQEFDRMQNTWTEKATITPLKRSRPTGFSINGKGYIISGLDNNTYLTDMHQYNPDLNTWTEIIPSLDNGIERNQAIGFVIDGKGYMGLGKRGQTNLGDMWEFNPDTETWTSKTPYPGTARPEASVTTLEGKAYMAFGYPSTSSADSDFWEYTPALDN